jgi:uncharacterized protein (TIGR00369 family)
MAEILFQEAAMTFDVPDPDFERRIRTSFARQGLNETIGATLGRVSAGMVEIEVPFSGNVSQQHGFFHGGVMGAIGDSACGYAAMTLTPPGTEVLTIEYKVNFLSPGEGDRLLARGRVRKPGRTVTVCTGDVFAVREGQEKLVATMLVTMMAVGGQPNLSTNRSTSGLPEAATHRQSNSPRWCPCRRLRGIRIGSAV